MLTYKLDFPIIEPVNSLSAHAAIIFLNINKEAEMKGYNGSSILCAVLLFGAILVSPVLAGMGKVDDAELSQINASVTGASVKKQINCVEKNGSCLETNQNYVTSDNVSVGSSQAVRSTATYNDDVNMNINGQSTFQFHFGGSSTVTGPGIISITPHN